MITEPGETFETKDYIISIAVVILIFVMSIFLYVPPEDELTKLQKEKSYLEEKVETAKIKLEIERLEKALKK